MLWQACVLRPGKQARALGVRWVKLCEHGGFNEEHPSVFPKECMCLPCHTQRLARFHQRHEGDLSAWGWDSFAGMLAGCCAARSCGSCGVWGWQKGMLSAAFQTRSIPATLKVLSDAGRPVR